MENDSNAGDENSIIGLLIRLVLIGLGIWLVGDALGLLMIARVS